MRQADVELHIERLILHDLPYDQRQRVAAAVEAELTRLLAEQGLPPGWQDRIPAIELELGPNETKGQPETIGQQIAAGVVGFNPE
jgi:hypothetical protein